MGKHSHHRADRSAGPGSGIALALVAPIGILAIVAMVLMWPSWTAPEAGASAEESTGTVLSIERVTCDEELPDDVNGCGTARVEADGASGTTSTIEVTLPNGIGAPELSEGDRVVMISSDTPDGVNVSIVDHQRGTELWVLGAAFVLALLAFGRLRGLMALGGLGITFGVLLLFVIPAILDGQPPVLVAIVGSAVIMITVLYLTHGFSKAISVAVLGTMASLALTVGLSALTVAGLHLTGVTDDLSATVGSVQQVNTQGLLLAGIVIGTLGVLDDITVTQAVTVEELVAANPQYSTREVYRAASRVGRAHIASVVNTIILAYAGSSLPVLILVVAADNSLGQVLTDQFIAQELVRSAVATLGLIAAVPLTTALAALVIRRSAASVSATAA